MVTFRHYKDATRLDKVQPRLVTNILVPTLDKVMVAFLEISASRTPHLEFIFQPKKI